MISRFRGALMGALIGDCVGAYWETKSWKGTHPLEDVKARLEEQLRETKSKKAPLISYTDDTALTIAVADSLLKCDGFDAKHMAKEMTDVYFDDTRRGYGQSVSTVFYKLRNAKSADADVFLPASEQFKGEGSCGNGSAMRISPVPLFCYQDDKQLISVCTESSKLTHSHISGINNAILQAMAIKLALQTKQKSINTLEFVDTLVKKIEPFETSVDNEDEAQQDKSDGDNSVASIKVQYMKGQPTCTSRLRQVRALLTQEKPPTAYDVQALLGHGVLAAEAVPCALYSFLQHSDSSFEEMIMYAVSLGGDTDTIASMAGAIGGAYFGIESIPQEWIDCCEGSSRIASIADSLCAHSV